MRQHRQLLQQVLSKLHFVPPSKDVSSREVQQLQEFVLKSKRLLVITGAGLSTESGIPDYRSEGVGLYARTDRRPMQFQDFIKSSYNRQRYWARNYVGWPTFASFQPNTAHEALSKWEQKGYLQWLVTQNVDSLHTKAGSKNVTELHGCSHRVVCLNCPEIIGRWELQEIFKKANPDFNETTVEIAPDGDVQLTEDQVKKFKVPDCPSCGGILKPDVIFFGDNVPRPKVNQVFEFVDDCDSILVAGSSLFVYSGFRFIQRASDQGKHIAILNIGQTRADKFARIKIDGRCGEVLSSINVGGLRS